MTTSRPARLLWLTLASPLVCVFVGTVTGVAYLAAVALATGELRILQTIESLPMFALYSLLIAGPLGLIAGVSGALLAGLLAEGTLRHATRRRWISFGGSAGGIVGLLPALYYVMTGAPLSFGVMTVIACACSGAILGVLASREFGSGVATD